MVFTARMLSTHLTALVCLGGLGWVQAGNRAVALDRPTMVAQSPTPSTNSQGFSSANRFGLRENMPYTKARSQLIQKGWQPNLQGDPPNRNDTTVRELLALGYGEVKDCAGTGLGPCRFEFTNAQGELLVVSTISEGRSNRNRVVWRWFLEKQAGSNPQKSALSSRKLPFVGTRYFNFYGGNGTGESITIAANGTTTVQRHGTMGSSLEYRGAFSNPLMLPDGTGLLFRGDRIYRVSARGEIIQNCKGDGKPCESGLYQPTPPPIVDGFYILGGTGQGLEVAGDRYRYYDEEGVKQWRPLSELTPISRGVVFDGQNYWCIPPNREGGVCTPKGWKSIRATLKIDIAVLKQL